MGALVGDLLLKVVGYVVDDDGGGVVDRCLRDG